MEFEEFLMKCNIQEPEEQTVARYLGGLNEEIANVIQLQPFWMLVDVTRQERVVRNPSKQRWVTPQNNKDHDSSCSSKSV